MSTEIVKATEVLPSQEEVVAQLDVLEASGDTQALNEVAARASAYQQYEARQNATERATYFGRVKVMAEARIGTIDLDLHPTQTRLSPLELNGTEIAKKSRSDWRVLGMGLRTGQLDRAMTLAEKRTDAVCTYSTVRELHDIGCLFVWTEPLLRRYRELYERQRLSVRDISRQAGFSHTTLRTFLTRPGFEPRNDKVTWHIALQVATILGVDPKELRSAPRRKANRKRNLRRARKLPGGRLDETYTLIRRALQELDATAGPSGKWGTGEAYDHLYKAEEIIGKALKYAPNA